MIDQRWDGVDHIATSKLSPRISDGKVYGAIS